MAWWCAVKTESAIIFIFKKKRSMQFRIVVIALFLPTLIHAQKKPLDHTVYDSWESIGEKLISSDGAWVVYSVAPQEGDNELVIVSADAKYRKSIPRGYNAVITYDNRFVVFKIRPWFRDTREAKIKKKKADEFPRDSLGIVLLGRDSVWKVASIKSFQVPEKSGGWLAYQFEKPVSPPARGRTTTVPARTIDSLSRIIDSLKRLVQQTARSGKSVDIDVTPASDAEGDEAAASGSGAGSTLVLRKMANGEERRFHDVAGYYWSENGQKLLLQIAKKAGDSSSQAMVLLYDVRKGFADTLSRGGNDFKYFTLASDGSQVAWVAERDAKPKDLQKTYKLWYFKDGMDSAVLLVDKNSAGMRLGMTVSQFGNLSFSKSGKRLFFGVSPIEPPKDSSLVDIDAVKVDVWHYNDDYLQTVQLRRLQRDLQENYMCVYDFRDRIVRQLGSREIPAVYQTAEGDGEYFVGVSDFGKRVESQWTATTKKDIYLINVNNGSARLVKPGLSGFIAPSYVSPSGKYLLWYDYKDKDYYLFDGDSARNITARIKVPLYDEENDVPNDARPYGLMGWKEGDSAVFIYDRYDIWKVNTNGPPGPVNLFAGKMDNRAKKISLRYVPTDPDKRAFNDSDVIVLRAFDHVNKKSGYNLYGFSRSRGPAGSWLTVPYSVNGIARARKAPVYLYTTESYQRPPNLVVAKGGTGDETGLGAETALSDINGRQKEFNWGTAELFRWKTFSGKESEGILYKPEDFNPSKKYPVIVYFYEELSDGLHGYIAPAPTPSRLNIPFFVSRGYIVFAPDIQYTIGHPAKSAYDYIVSGAKAITRFRWVDADHMGLQGQSWGGIQVAQLITMTNMFKAAWAGAPVANMTSAYGGIRWESGLSRQFQYEKTQSRIGATLWEKPELYIENSPLFAVPKIKTPLVIMANDADGAVPWYQGIELFTAMRRLGKKVWMLNYNGEAHNLVERKNRKDIQVRQQQYFDWLLKGAKPSRWIVEGVPAVKKGKDWGLEIVD